MTATPGTSASGTDIGTDLAMRRTGMAFQRTRMSADRTLMAIIRTSLSLISFGFTIYQFFQKLKDSNVLASARPARNFGTSLLLLGMGMLILGIAYHVLFMLELRRARDEMKSAGLIRGQSKFPPSLTLITALALLAIGAIAALSMILHIGPYG